MTRDQSPTPTVAAIGEMHFEGNVIPHTFYSRPEFKSDKGQTQLLAIAIYADDLYWYRPTQHRNEMTGLVERVTRKFAGDMLQRTYDYYADMFGVTKEMATAAVKFNVDRGLTVREFRTIRLPDGRKASNVMFVEPVVDALRALLHPEAPDSPRWYWVAEPPKPNVKKEKGEGQEGGIPNKPDTYPEYSGYLSQVDRRRIRSIPETNTETSTETSSKTSPKNSSSSTPAPPAVTGQRPNDDDQAADAGTQEGTPGQVTPEGGEGLPLTGNGGTQVKGPKLDQATGRENVPPAAAAPVDGSAILALTPVPRAELEARPSRDPVSNRRLRALMSCSNTSAKRLQHMHDQLAQATRSGLPREWFCRLTDAELELAAAAAQTDAHMAQGQMGGAGYYALERMIGEPLTLARLTGTGSEPAQAPLGHAYEVKNAGQPSAPSAEPEPDRPADAIEPGTRWEHKKIQDKIVTIVGIDGGKVELHTGECLLSYLLTRDYRRVD